MVEVCDICGHGGFSNALLYCSECSDTSVHQYCLGIPPGSIDDTFNWVCEYCSPLVESESRTCRKFPGSFSQGIVESCGEHAGVLKLESDSEIVAFLDQPEPLCTLLPVQYHGSSGQVKTSNQPQVAEGFLSKVYTSMGHSLNYRQEHEVPYSSFMDHPESIMRGLVLLVTPSGEVIIHRGTSFCDNSHLILGMASSSDCFYLDKAFEKSSPYEVKPDLSPLDINVENNEDYDIDETTELDDPSIRTGEEINACHLNEPSAVTKITGHRNSVVDTDVMDMEDNASLKVEDVELEVLYQKLASSIKKGKRRRHRQLLDFAQDKAAVVSNNSVGSSMQELRRGTRKRTVDPKEEILQRKKASVAEAEAEDLSNKSVGNSKKKGKHETLKMMFGGKGKSKVKNARNMKLSYGTTKKSVRNYVVELLLSAGWTVEYRPRNGRIYNDAVYVNPQGKAHWSAPKAYRSLQQDVKKGKVVCGSGNSNFSFTPIPEKVLSILYKPRHIGSNIRRETRG